MRNGRLVGGIFLLLPNCAMAKTTTVTAASMKEIQKETRHARWQASKESAPKA
jgi:hypothetical protein